ncbi:MAG TPA: DUF547 domain-containing protein [Burkholderiaceae bacterium]|nr:DUF547 domain-containing protein [Burkholderiaceae bacterium]
MTLLRRAALGLAVCALAGCSTLVAPPVGPAPSATGAQAAWARVLQRFVDTRGEVDFAALAADRSDLDVYLRYIADTPLSNLPEGPPRLAHMINAYNALSMFNVIDSGIPATHAGFNKVGFFVLRKLQVGGQPMSLRSFENDLIRPHARGRGDPRIHFALNCSALSCPVLPREPFTAAALEEQLERETRAFFARAQNFRVDDAAVTVWLSELLDFYPEDFVPVPAASLLAYANRYAPRPAPLHYAVRFTPYDWTVANSRRAR